MATQRILPIGDDASYNSWGQGGGSTKYGNMDPAHANSFSTSYIGIASIGTYYQGFTKTVPYPRVSITSWTTYIGGGKNANSAQSVFGMYKKGVGWIVNSNCYFNIFIWSVQGVSQAWPSPTDANVDSTDTIFLVYNTDDDGTHPSYVDYFYADFVFVAAGETFISIWSLVSSLLGTGLLLKDMPAISKWLFRNHQIRFDKDEYQQALRLWKEHKFTRYFDLRSNSWQMHALSSAA